MSIIIYGCILFHQQDQLSSIVDGEHYRIRIVLVEVVVVFSVTAAPEIYVYKL